MAERRMFSKLVVTSDNFLDMSIYAQDLYFMLGMFADDDGFVGSPKRVMRQCGIKESALQELLVNNYIIRFKSGIIVLTHWLVQNTMKRDRYHKTIYQNEYSKLLINDTKIYELSEKNTVETDWKQNGNKTETEYSIDKYSIDKDNIYTVSDKPKTDTNRKHKHGKFKNVLLSDDDIKQLKEKFPADYDKRIEKMSAAIEMKGYKYKNHYLALLNWAERENTQKSKKPDLTDPERYKGDIKL